MHKNNAETRLQVGATPPVAPADVAVEFVTRTEIFLVWTASNGAKHYKVLLFCCLFLVLQSVQATVLSRWPDNVFRAANLREANNMTAVLSPHNRQSFVHRARHCMTHLGLELPLHNPA